MKNINSPQHSPSLLKPALLIAGLAALIGGCRPRVLDNISDTVGSLEENCGKVIASSGINVSADDSGVKAVGQNGDSCECSEGEVFNGCFYQNPDKSKKVSGSSVNAQVSRDGRHIKTSQTNKDGVSEMRMGIVNMDGMPVCVKVGELSDKVGITPEACENFGLSIKERLEAVANSLNAKLDKK